MYLFGLQICLFEYLLQRFWRYELQDVSGRSALMNLLRAASPRPDLLEFTAGSDVSIVVEHEI